MTVMPDVSSKVDDVMGLPSVGILLPLVSHHISHYDRES